MNDDVKSSSVKNINMCSRLRLSHSDKKKNANKKGNKNRGGAGGPAARAACRLECRPTHLTSDSETRHLPLSAAFWLYSFTETDARLLPRKRVTLRGWYSCVVCTVSRYSRIRFLILCLHPRPKVLSPNKP